MSRISKGRPSSRGLFSRAAKAGLGAEKAAPVTPTATVHLTYSGRYVVRLNGADYGSDYAAACAFVSRLGIPRTADTSETFD